MFSTSLQVALDAHGDDSAAADAPLLLFREPTDTLMNIGCALALKAPPHCTGHILAVQSCVMCFLLRRISMVNSLGRAGEESLAALMVALSALGLAAEARTALSAAVLDHVRCVRLLPRPGRECTWCGALSAERGPYCTTMLAAT